VRNWDPQGFWVTLQDFRDLSAEAFVDKYEDPARASLGNI
jgi:hypothetical protein